MRTSHQALHIGELQGRAADWRLPAYQRGYVWSERQALDLADSLAHGYPIGTVVVWRPPGADWRVRLVIDGQQRVSTLLGHRVGSPGEPTHDVWLAPRGTRIGGGVMPLRAMHHTLSWLYAHADRDDAHALLDSPLYRGLERATVGVLDLEQASPAEVVEVFRRLALGSPLTPGEAEAAILRALEGGVACAAGACGGRRRADGEPEVAP